ncbi:MAG: hypothetical protein IJR17_03635 [Clostridia bacterium]|nr:hypothetical protein [Clostridia bacterium]
MTLSNIFLTFLFFGAPSLAVLWFIVSLVCYLVFKKKNKQDPAACPEGKVLSWRNSLVASGILSAILVLFMGGIFALILSAVRHP